MTVKLEAGVLGIDHSGPAYAEREYEVLSIDGNEITVRYTDNGSEKTYPLAAKQKQFNEILSVNNRLLAYQQKRPGYLSVDEITWDGDGRLAHFLGYLLGPGNVRFYLEAPPKHQTAVENLYHELTSDVIQPTVGLFNIAPENKWYSEANISFVPTVEIPDSLGRMQSERAGLISRIQLFWSLIRLGFRLEKQQDVNRIRQSVPVAQQAAFDKGLNS